MSGDPFPICPRKYCGFPITGCRDVECINPKCRASQLTQGVELKHKPVNEYEFLDKFDSEEPRWRSSTRYIDPSYGYQPPFRPHRHHLESDVTLECNGIPAKEEPWRSIHKYIPSGTGAFSESWRPCHRYINPGHQGLSDNWKPCIKCFDTCSEPTSEITWKSHIRCYSGQAGSETTQPDFHSTLRYIPSGGNEEPMWHPGRGPGTFKREDSWLPPFRTTTPEMESKAAAGCISWQCPKRGRRMPCRQDEWHPPFRSNHHYFNTTLQQSEASWKQCNECPAQHPPRRTSISASPREAEHCEDNGFDERQEGPVIQDRCEERKQILETNLQRKQRGLVEENEEVEDKQSCYGKPELKRRQSTCQM